MNKKMLTLVSDVRASRGDPFVVFTSFFDTKTSLSRFIYNNDHTGPGSIVRCVFPPSAPVRNVTHPRSITGSPVAKSWARTLDLSCGRMSVTF
jgi:hypothetical protein